MADGYKTVGQIFRAPARRQTVVGAAAPGGKDSAPVRQKPDRGTFLTLVRGLGALSGNLTEQHGLAHHLKPAGVGTLPASMEHV